MNAASYNRFVAGVQPTRIELGEVNASAKPSNLQELNVRVDTKFTMGCVQSNTQARTFDIEARLQMQFLTDKGLEVGRFICLYHLSYLSAEALEDSVLEEFTRRNAPVHVWPFMRELVLNLTQRFGWTGFVLPSFFIPSAAAVVESGVSQGGSVNHLAETTNTSKVPAKKPRRSAPKSDA
ncbi:hypothetical protein [Deinococcus arcticus]|nr:hypothetical protein [Deinococcus arcticus]